MRIAGTLITVVLVLLFVAGLGTAVWSIAAVQSPVGLPELVSENLPVVASRIR